MSNESMDMNLSKLKFSEIVKDREVWRAAVHGVAKIWSWLSDWTNLKIWISVAQPDSEGLSASEVNLT